MLSKPRTEMAFIVDRTKRGVQVVTKEMAYERNLQRSTAIREAGYNLVEKWSHEMPKPRWNCKEFWEENETFSHASVYDFDALQDVTKRFAPTSDLLFESEHVPISVSLADTLDRLPEHIMDKDPDRLVIKFWASLGRRGNRLRQEICAQHTPDALEYLPKP